MNEGDERERELEAFLRRAGGPHPDPDYRARARRAFLAGGPEELGAAHGSRAAPPHRKQGVTSTAPLDPEEEDAFLDWIADLTAEAPDAAARRRARLAFLSAVGSAAPPPAQPVSRRRHALVLLLAAAAIAAVTVLLPERERWSARLEGAVLLDGRRFEPGSEERLAAELAGSGTLETAGAPLALSAGALELRLFPGARLAVAALPALDGASPIDLELERGELFLRTSSRWPGNPIVVRTPLADVTLHGTTVGVLADELGTCVCVADGTARVLSPNLGGFAMDVGPRSTVRIWSERGRDADAGPFPPEGAPEAAHTRPLEEFHRRF